MANGLPRTDTYNDGFHKKTTQGDTDWMKDANCRGVDGAIFFVERGASMKEAKVICAGCEVRETCLDYAVTHHITHGFWGGLSERSRREVARRRRRTAVSSRQIA